MELTGTKKIKIRKDQQEAQDSKGASAKVGDIRKWDDGTYHIKTAYGWKFYSGAGSGGQRNKGQKKIKVRPGTKV